MEITLQISSKDQLLGELTLPIEEEELASLVLLTTVIDGEDEITLEWTPREVPAA